MDIVTLKTCDDAFPKVRMALLLEHFSEIAEPQRVRSCVSANFHAPFAVGFSDA